MRFSLARALAATGGAAKRIDALARQAEETYRQAGRAAGELRKVETWRRRRPARR